MDERAWIGALLVVLGMATVVPAKAESRALADLRSFEAAVAQVGDASCAPRTEATVLRQWAPAARRSDWRFLVAPYGWLAGVQGTVVTEGVETEIDVPFSELADRTNAGFQLYLEARWKKWFVAFDGTWAELGDASGGALGGLDIVIRQRLFDIRMGYEVFRRSRDGVLDPCCEAWRRWIVVDAFVGARYWWTEQIVTLTALDRPLAKTQGTDERWDPFFGARFGIDLTRRLGFFVRGDIGGFGLGDAAQMAWQASGGINIDLTSWMHLGIGYRALYYDTIEGQGTQRSGQKLTQHGPLIGIGFTF